MNVSLKQLPSLCLFVFVLLLSAGCKKTIDDPIPDPTSNYILAGESDSHIYITDWSANPLEIPTNQGQAFNPGTMPDSSFIFYNFSFPTTNPSNYYTTITPQKGVQLAIYNQSDEIYLCPGSSPFSPTAQQYSYNLLSGYTCSNGSSTYLKSDVFETCVTMAKGSKIDKSLQWENGFRFLNLFNQHVSNEGGISTNKIIHYPGFEGLGIKYIGFRIPNSTEYRYGYIKLEVTSDMKIMIHQIAVENP